MFKLKARPEHSPDPLLGFSEELARVYQVNKQYDGVSHSDADAYVSFDHPLTQHINDLLELKNAQLRVLFTENLKLMNQITSLDSVHHLLDLIDSQRLSSQDIQASAKEMSAAIEDVANLSQQSAEKAQSTTEKASSAKQELEKASEGIDTAYQSVRQVEARLQGVKDKTRAIEEVTAIISGVADQTNLLALNASIEAARAGEHGKGFSVVASEITKLASHTKQSLEQIDQIMQELSKEIIASNDAMSGAVQTFDSSKDILNASNVKIDHIVQGMDSLNDYVENMSASVQQQAATTEEISAKTEHVANKTEELYALSRETGRGIYDISKKNYSIKTQALPFYKALDMESLTEVTRTDHLTLYWQVRNAIHGFVDLSVKDVSTKTTCSLGRHLSNLEQQNPDHPQVKLIKRDHDRLHALAEETLSTWLQTNQEGAVAHLLEEFKDVMDSFDKKLNQMFV